MSGDPIIRDPIVRGAQPWRDHSAEKRDEAIRLLRQRIPFNQARLAELADLAAPLPSGYQPKPAGDVSRVLP